MNDQCKRMLAIQVGFLVLMTGCSSTTSPPPSPAAVPASTPAPAAPPAAAATVPAGNAPAEPGMSAAARLMFMLDSDGDRRISREEHAGHSRDMFETMDTDHDGKVSNDEMDAVRRQYYGDKRSPTAREIARVDSNGDGVMSAEEHETATRAEFDRMDADHDGFLTTAELDAAQAASQPKPGPTR